MAMLDFVMHYKSQNLATMQWMFVGGWVIDEDVSFVVI